MPQHSVQTDLTEVPQMLQAYHLLEVVQGAEAVSDGLLQLRAGRLVIAGLLGAGWRQLAPPERVVPVPCSNSLLCSLSLQAAVQPNT